MIDLNKPLTKEVQKQISFYAAKAQVSYEDSEQDFFVKVLELQDNFDETKGTFLAYVFTSLYFDISKTAPKFFDDSFHDEENDKFSNIETSESTDPLDLLIKEEVEIEATRNSSLPNFDRNFLKAELSLDKSRSIGDRMLQMLIKRTKERIAYGDLFLA